MRAQLSTDGRENRRAARNRIMAVADPVAAMAPLSRSYLDRQALTITGEEPLDHIVIT